MTEENKIADRFLEELEKAKNFQKYSDKQEYWMEYILGLYSAYTKNL